MRESTRGAARGCILVRACRPATARASRAPRPPTRPSMARARTPSIVTGPAAPALSPRRRRLFFAITLALPWGLLLLAELLLRAAGYGGSHPLFVAASGRPDWLVANPAFGKRYFGAGPFVPTP